MAVSSSNICTLFEKLAGPVLMFNVLKQHKGLSIIFYFIKHFSVQNSSFSCSLVNRTMKDRFPVKPDAPVATSTVLYFGFVISILVRPDCWAEWSAGQT